jgi:predicted ATPase/class 3 adenylate cyclase
MLGRQMTDRVLPTGTVTFLFSDMEGSTRLVQDLGPAAFTRILEQHNALLREAFAGHGGTERGTQGDSFLVLFPEAPAAIAAAAAAQTGLHAAGWPADATVRVRMGLHTGLGTLGGDDYVGVDVNRAARIAALAHGGQVLLSDATRVLVEDRLPAGVGLRSLGEHGLRGLARPERLHQLTITGVPSDFPALRSSLAAAGNMPARLSSFVGREAELALLDRLLDERRLVTLTGPGGTGKTRLAIELAWRTAARFRDGVWLVRLDAVREPSLVPAAIATAVGLVETPGTTPVERLRDFLADRSILLVLDNFEQVLGAGPIAGELLEGAPGLRIVATSRAPLRLSLEQEFPVAPLSLPGETNGASDARSSDAVRLFIERARRARPAYDPGPDEIGSIAEICRRMDGLPLGIELAAARVGLLPARALAQRLTSRLDLPGSATRDLPERQQTLEAAIAWSHDLLDAPARRLLGHLSVFAGGFRLEEAEAVAGPVDEAGADVIDALSVLVDHSLAEPMAGPDVPRFRLLETIRVFATARLAETTEAPEARRRHALAYLALGEDAARHMPGRGQVPWLDRLAIEHHNLRAALAWAIGTGEAEMAHRLASASWRFWQFRGHVAEGRDVVADVLAMRGGDAPTEWRVRALEAAGGLAWWAADLPGADARYREQLALARSIGDRLGTADALFNLCHTSFILWADAEELAAMRSEARAIYLELGEERSVARLDWSAAYPVMRDGRYAEAAEIVALAAQRFDELEDGYYLPIALASLGGIALASGDLETAIRMGLRCLQGQHAMGDIASITLSLRGAAVLWHVVGEPRAAATIYAAYEAHCRRYGVRPPLNPEAWMGIDLEIDRVLAELPAGATPEDAERGAAMTTDEAIEYITELAAGRRG